MLYIFKPQKSERDGEFDQLCDIEYRLALTSSSIYLFKFQNSIVVAIVNLKCCNSYTMHPLNDACPK